MNMYSYCTKLQRGCIIPNKDKAGPLGEGPNTGRGFGLCNKTENIKKFFRKGFGRKFDSNRDGRRMNRRFYQNRRGGND